MGQTLSNYPQKIPSSSQVLVFSKTSFQKEKISKDKPRALYYNEKSYVAKVQDSDMLEITSYDKNSGAVFYTLSPGEKGSPKLVRNDEDCLSCHSSAKTQSVPGVMLRSTFLHKNDSLFSTTVNHRTPLK